MNRFFFAVSENENPCFYSGFYLNQVLLIVFRHLSCLFLPPWCLGLNMKVPILLVAFSKPSKSRILLKKTFQTIDNTSIPLLRVTEFFKEPSFQNFAITRSIMRQKYIQHRCAIKCVQKCPNFIIVAKPHHLTTVGNADF